LAYPQHDDEGGREDGMESRVNGEFRVVLIDPSGESDEETVFRSSDKRRIARWVRNWIDDPLGLIVAVCPPDNVLTPASNVSL
jgi:hypothetical protein